MHALKSAAVLVAALAVTGAARAQVISTGTTSNNGSGGIFLSLTPSGPALQMTSFSTQFSSAAGTPVSIEVWTRPGPYAGFTTSNAGWTLTETVSGVSGGTLTDSPPITLGVPISVPAGATTSVYLHSITVGGGIRYFGTGTTSQSTYTNPDVTLFTDISRTGNVSFGGTQFTPRAFVGSIGYSVVPEPSSMVLCGTLIAAAGWRRWRRAKGQSV
jgi:hypothetical protein